MPVLATLAFVLLQQPFSMRSISYKKIGIEATARVPQFGSSAVGALASRDLMKIEKREMDKWLREATKWRREDNRPDQEPYVYESSATVAWSSPSLVSVYFDVYSATGGAHPSSWFRFGNYGLSNGKAAKIKLRDLFTSDARPVISRLVLKKLKATGRADWINDGTVKTLKPEQFEQFVVTKSGLTFMFEAYAMGSYAAGPFEIKVAYGEMNPLSKSRLLNNALAGK